MKSNEQQVRRNRMLREMAKLYAFFFFNRYGRTFLDNLDMKNHLEKLVRL